MAFLPGEIVPKKSPFQARLFNAFALALTQAVST
jgi:hypothetical protein